MRDEGRLVKIEITCFVNISGDACFDACGNLYLSQYFRSLQIKLYLLIQHILFRVGIKGLTSKRKFTYSKQRRVSNTE